MKAKKRARCTPIAHKAKGGSNWVNYRRIYLYMVGTVFAGEDLRGWADHTVQQAREDLS